MLAFCRLTNLLILLIISRKCIFSQIITQGGIKFISQQESWISLVSCKRKSMRSDCASLVTGLPSWLSWWRICPQCGRPGFDPWVGKMPWRRERLPTPEFWPGEFHGSPWGCKESDTTEQLSLSCTAINVTASYFIWEWSRYLINLHHLTKLQSFQLPESLKKLFLSIIKHNYS